MSFSFGATPTAGFGAPATAAPTGGFGSPTPSLFGAPAATAPAGFGAPAPTGLFGAPAAPAPAFGSPAPASFGAAAPAAPLFGATPAAPSTFGAPTAPAPSFGGFGIGAPAAPAAGGSLFGGFGSTPAPSGGLFGAPAPSTSLFGAAPAAMPFSSPQAFGAATPAPPQRGEHIAGHKYYSQLTPDMKRAIDTMHDAIMRHKQTMNDVQTIGPSVLQGRPTSEIGSGPNGGAAAVVTPLQEQIQKLQAQLVSLRRDVTKLSAAIHEQTKTSEKIVSQTITYAKWPLEALASRQRVPLTTTTIDRTAHTTNEEEKKSDEAAREMQLKIRDVLNQGMAAVDRIDHMPSPYYWETLQSLEQRARVLSERVAQTEVQWNERESSMCLMLAPEESSPGAAITSIVETQHMAVLRLMSLLDSLHNEMHRVRLRYGQYERSENVLERAAASKMERERKLHEQTLSQFLRSTVESSSQPTGATTLTQSGLGSALRPPTFGAPAPAAPSAFGGFGSPAPTSTFGAPAPSATAPAPTFGAPASVFGSAPAPATGGLFGAAPAPATAGLFGAAPATGAAPAPLGFGNFASTSSLSSKKKNPPRGGNARRR